MTGLIISLTSCKNNYIQNKDIDESPAKNITSENPISELEDGIPPECIFLNDTLYFFFDNYTEYDLTGLDYIGEVTSEIRGNHVPQEEFASFGFPVGSPIYRIDDNSLVVEYNGNYHGYAVGYPAELFESQ